MELKPGYKQTEVGVIPEDWDVTSLTEHCDLVTKGTTPTSIGRSFTRSGVTFLKAESLSESGQPIPEKVAFIDEATDALLRRSRLCSNDLLISIAGVLGRVGLVRERDLPANTNQALAIIRLSARSQIEHGFLFHALRSSSVSRQIRDINVKGAQANISLQDVRSLLVTLPPHPEQEIIVSILSDTEDYISSLNRLVVKKQNLKQATMQELLTGKRRLPGFEGEWEVKRLGDEIRDLEAGVSVRSTTDKDQLSTGRYILKTSAVSQGQFSPTERKEIISCDISRAKTPIKQGDLIISRMNTPSLVGECGYSQLDHPNLFLPDRLWRTAYRDPHAVSSRWLAYTLSTQHNRARIKELATGTSGSMKNISKRALLNLEIKWPSMEEQIAIAEVLSEMDSDIDSLNDQLQKAQGIKQGMMQQLLTGKIRLK